MSSIEIAPFQNQNSRPLGPSILDLPPSFDKATPSNAFLDTEFISEEKESQFSSLTRVKSYNVRVGGVDKLDFLAVGEFSQVNTHSKDENIFRRHCNSLRKISSSFKPDSRVDPLFRFPILKSFSTDEILDIFETKTYSFGILTERGAMTLEKHSNFLVEERGYGFSEDQLLGLIKSLSSFLNACHGQGIAVHNLNPANISVQQGQCVFNLLNETSFFESDFELIDKKSQLLSKYLPESGYSTYNPKKADSYFVGLLALSLARNKNMFVAEYSVTSELFEISQNLPRLYAIISQALDEDPEKRISVFEVFRLTEAESAEKFITPFKSIPKEEIKKSEVELQIELLLFECFLGRNLKLKESAKSLIAKLTVLPEPELFSNLHTLLSISSFLIHTGAYDTTANALHLVEKNLRSRKSDGKQSIELETELLAVKAAMKYEKKDFDDLEEYLKTAFKSINSNLEKFKYNVTVVSMVCAGLSCLYKLRSNQTEFDLSVSEWTSIFNSMQVSQEPYRKISEIKGDFAFSLGNFSSSRDSYIRSRDLVFNAFGSNHPDFITLSLKIAQAYVEEGSEMEGFEYADKGLDAGLESYGENHRLMIPPLTTLGQIYFKKGGYTKSLNLYEKATEIFVKVCGRENPGYPSLANNIAILNSKTGNHKKALEFANLALKSKEEVMKAFPVMKTFELKISSRRIDITEGFDSEYLRILNNVGLFQSLMGDKVKAEVTLVEAYSIGEELKRSRKGDFFVKKASAEILANLALLNQELGRYDTALKYFNSCDQEFSNLNIDYYAQERYKIRFNLAKLHTEERNFTEAKSLYISLENEFASKANLDSATLLNNIGSMHYLAGEKEDAKGYFQRSYDMKMGIFQSEDNEDVAVSLCNLALVADNYDEALERYMRALEILKGRMTHLSRKNQVIHQDIATIENNIGLILIRKRDFDRALEMLINSRDKRAQIYGTTHHEIGVTWNNIGICYFAKGDVAFAKESFRKALEIKSMNLRDGHPSVQDSLFNLVMILERGEKYSEAKALLESRIANAKATYKQRADSEEYADFFNGIAEMYDMLKEIPKATKYYSEALDLYSRVLGSDHSKTMKVSKLIQARRATY